MTAPALTRTNVRETLRSYTADMARRRIVSIREARASLRDRIDGAQDRGEHTILVRRSKVAAVVVPPSWYRDACRLMGDPWEDWEPPADADDES
jgi:hypothetical protein